MRFGCCLCSLGFVLTLLLCNCLLYFSFVSFLFDSSFKFTTHGSLTIIFSVFTGELLCELVCEFSINALCASFLHEEVRDIPELPILPLCFPKSFTSFPAVFKILFSISFLERILPSFNS